MKISNCIYLDLLLIILLVNLMFFYYCNKIEYTIYRGQLTSTDTKTNLIIKTLLKLLNMWSLVLRLHVHFPFMYIFIFIHTFSPISTITLCTHNKNLAIYYVQIYLSNYLFSQYFYFSLIFLNFYIHVVFKNFPHT